MAGHFAIERILETALRKKSDEVFLDPGQPVHLYRQGQFLADLDWVFTKNDAARCYENLVPDDLRESPANQSVSFEFGFGRLCRVRAYCDRRDESCRFRLILVALQD